jgi:hypothetical protein
LNIIEPPTHQIDVFSCVRVVQAVGGCARDLLKVADTYVSWSAQLLQAALPVARKAAGPPCARVMKSLSNMVQKAAATKKTAPADVGIVQDAVDALRSLVVESKAVATRLLGESARLARDAEREIQESIAEAKASPLGGASAHDTDEKGEDDEGEEEEEEEEGGLLGLDSIAMPLSELVSMGAQTIEASKDVIAATPSASWTPQHDAVLHSLITCGQAASTCIDSAACAAYEADAKALMGHVTSLSKVLLKLVEVLRQRCGVVEGHTAAGRLASIEASIERNLAALKVACAAAADDDDEQDHQKALAAMTIS